MLGRWAVPKRLTLVMEIVAGARQSGGPSEIVENQRQIYHDSTDAIQKSSPIAMTPDLQEKLHSTTRERGERFSPEIFTKRIKEVVSQVASSKHPRDV